MTNKFLFKILMSYVPKNKMDEEINQYFISLDATLVNSRWELTAFRKAIRSRVAEIHTHHPRCKKLTLDLFSHTGKDESLKCGSTHGIIYEINHEYVTTEI